MATLIPDENRLLRLVRVYRYIGNTSGYIREHRCHLQADEAPFYRCIGNISSYKLTKLHLGELV